MSLSSGAYFGSHSMVSQSRAARAARAALLVWMGERFRLVAEQQDDVAGFGLLPQQAQAQAGAVDRVGVLPTLQRVPRPAPSEAPFFSTTLGRDAEMRLPVRFLISSTRRGNVQFGRADTPGANTASITDKAARAFTGSGPGAGGRAGAQPGHPFPTKNPAPMAHAVGLHAKCQSNPIAGPSLQRQQDGTRPIRFLAIG
jgi:hypothetical protein